MLCFANKQISPIHKFISLSYCRANAIAELIIMTSNFSIIFKIIFLSLFGNYPSFLLTIITPPFLSRFT